MNPTTESKDIVLQLGARRLATTAAATGRVARGVINSPGLTTRSELVAEIGRLQAELESLRLSATKTPTTTRPATTRTIPAPSRTPVHDQLEKLTGSAKTAFYRRNKDRLSAERKYNP